MSPSESGRPGVPLSSERLGRIGRVLNHGLATLAMFAGLLVIGLSLNILRHDQRFLDLGTYYRAGQIVLLHHWATLYDNPSFGLPYVYPPFAALVFAPLALLPFPLLAAVWSTVGLASYWIVLIKTCPTMMALPRWQFLVTVLGSLPVWWTLMLGQIGLVLFALAGTSWWLLGRGTRYPWLAALPLGLTLAIKPIFLAFPLYLWLRQQRGAAAWSVAWCGLFSLLGLATMGLGPTLQFVQTVAPTVSHPAVSMVTEQSIAVEFYHFWGARAGELAGTCVLVLVTAATAYGCTRLSVRTEEAFALAMAAGLLAWPHTWDHYFVLLAPAQVLLWHARPRIAALVYLLTAAEYLTYFVRIQFPLDAAAAAIVWLWLLSSAVVRPEGATVSELSRNRSWSNDARLERGALGTPH